MFLTWVNGLFIMKQTNSKSVTRSKIELGGGKKPCRNTNCCAYGLLQLFTFAGIITPNFIVVNGNDTVVLINFRPSQKAVRVFSQTEETKVGKEHTSSYPTGI